LVVFVAVVGCGHHRDSEHSWVTGCLGHGSPKHKNGRDQNGVRHKRDAPKI
jgi:hypothetical protein